jgi:hypothetical protein
MHQRMHQHKHDQRTRTSRAHTMLEALCLKSSTEYAGMFCALVLRLSVRTVIAGFVHPCLDITVWGQKR